MRGRWGFGGWVESSDSVDGPLGGLGWMQGNEAGEEEGLNTALLSDVMLKSPDDDQHLPSDHPSEVR